VDKNTGILHFSNVYPCATATKKPFLYYGRYMLSRLQLKIAKGTTICYSMPEVFSKMQSIHN